MAEVVIMPKLGFNMDVGKLVKWYKSEGDKIKKGEPFFAIETDKTNIDIEATCDGVVKKLLIQEGDSVAVTTPIAIIGEENEDVEELIQKELSVAAGDLDEKRNGPIQEKEEKKTETVQQPSVNRLQGTDRIKITPRARRIAKENNLDIERLPIVGTGFQGGICARDVLNFLEESKVKATPLALKLSELEKIDLSTVQGSGVKGKVMKQDVEGVINRMKQKESEIKEETAQEIAVTEDGKEVLEVVPYSGIRKIIGDRMSQSKFTAPHLYFTRSVDMSNLLAFRKQVNASQEKKTSVTDYIVLAVVKALQKYPDVNASLIGDKIYKYKSINVGVAVAADSGLIVPVIKNAEKMSLLEISTEASRLIEKARAGKLLPAEYTGGTFSVSNLGMFGIENFTAIINPPEAAILAVSATEKRAVVVTNEKGEDEIVIRPMMNITLTVDHRLIDGALAAQFVGEVKAQLENPVGLVL
ncbi:MAG TPA: 2-oxo acid dehydrogenase subunit E2 [Clostridiales bacterium]|nr:2-oxo acid dehydrogenase subunit E2 [Clostridiales bacterium]